MMRRQRCALLLAAAAGIISAGWTAESKLLSPGTAAPSFSLPTLSGQREALSVYCGKVLSKPYVNSTKHIVILSFWATYCKPCQKEIPELMQFIKKHPADSIKVFCISIDKEGATIVAPFVKDKNYDIPVLLDPFGTAAGRYGLQPRHQRLLFIES